MHCERRNLTFTCDIKKRGGEGDIPGKCLIFLNINFIFLESGWQTIKNVNETEIIITCERKKIKPILSTRVLHESTFFFTR